MAFNWPEAHLNDPDCDAPTHPKYINVPQDALHTRRAWDEGIEATEDDTAEGLLIDAVGDNHSYFPDWSPQVLDRPVCHNEKCRNYGVEED